MKIFQTLRLQIGQIKRNPVVFLFLILTSGIILYTGYLHDTLVQSIAYLFVMWLCSFIIDLFTYNHKYRQEFPIKKPKKEFIVFIVFAFLGILFLVMRFCGPIEWENMQPMMKLAILPLMLFTFPFALAAVMLLWKYKLPEMGFRLQGFHIALVIMIISFITNRIVCPERLTWEILMEEEGGILGVIFTGIIVAGLSEEFFRTIGQTRLGKYFGNFGIGWLITTIIWAFMHAPKWLSESHDLTDTVLSAIRIIPIGLMWGYLTHRTKSLLPSVLVHGTNFWGLQNF